eukprot:GGOE01061337.1.p1 GENE.GGOE01061337.1~~GGOE01061337.1.p1  ORF type:complete len:334 (+),score=97.35 GGOE01061337.1:41-1003(+)
MYDHNGDRWSEPWNEPQESVTPHWAPPTRKGGKGWHAPENPQYGLDEEAGPEAGHWWQRPATGSKGKGKGQGKDAALLSRGGKGRDADDGSAAPSTTDPATPALGGRSKEAALQEITRHLEEAEKERTHLELGIARRLRAHRGQHQQHYYYVMVDRDDHGCDKFFGGTRGIPDDWAAWVFFNRNTTNNPREYPKGAFDLKPTLIGGRKVKPGAASNSFFDIHYRCGKLVKKVMAPEETFFFAVCGERGRYGELQAQLKKLGCNAEHFNGSDKDFGALLKQNFVDTAEFYWAPSVPTHRSRTPVGFRAKGQGDRRSHSAFR